MKSYYAFKYQFRKVFKIENFDGSPWIFTLWGGKQRIGEPEWRSGSVWGNIYQRNKRSGYRAGKGGKDPLTQFQW